MGKRCYNDFVTTLPKYLTQDELKRFFAIELPRDKALFGVIYYYGLHVGEALLLTVDDVNFKNQRQVQKLFTDHSQAAGIKVRAVHALRHSMAVHLLEAGRGIECVADHLGHKNIQNTRIYAQITNPLREQVSRELAQHPKIVRIS